MAKTPIENNDDNLAQLKHEFDAKVLLMSNAIEALTARISNLESRTRPYGSTMVAREGTQAGHIDDLPKVPGL